MAYNTRVYSFTENGKLIADRICMMSVKNFRCEKLVFCKAEDNIIDEHIFLESNAHVFVGAIGIAVRKIAPYINNKLTDPAVIVVDEKGEYVIPILSGHVGGANVLAEIIARELNAKAVITTATDVNGLNAIDSIAADNRLLIQNKDFIKTVNTKLLNGEVVKVYADESIELCLDKSGIYEKSCLDDADVCILSTKDLKHKENALAIYNKRYIVGVGCRKNKDSDLFKETLNATLDELNISIEDIDRIVSIDLKRNEQAIINYSREYGIMFETYSPEELNSVCGNFDESEFVKEVTGVSNVSQRAAVYSAELFLCDIAEIENTACDVQNYRFIEKRKSINGITISIIELRKRIILNGKA